MEYIPVKTRWMLSLICTIVFLTNSQVYAAESIGRVIYTTGEIQAVNGGKARILKRGSNVYEGDTVHAGRHTQSQLRMSDGALIALRSSSEIRFDQYRYQNDQNTDSSVFSLIKGGFRTISGWIGRNNKKNYQVKTPVATIGIRGTHYGLTLCEQDSCNEDSDESLEDGLYGSVIDGEIIANNDAGSFTFSNDEYFYIGNRHNSPTYLQQSPNVVFGQGKLVKLKRMEQKGDQVAAMAERRGRQTGDILRTNFEIRQDFIQNQLQPLFETTNDTTDENSSQLLPAPRGSVLGFSLFELNPDTGNLDSSIVKLRSDGTEENTFNLNTVALNHGLLIPVNAFETTATSAKRLLFADARIINPMTISIPGTRTADGKTTTVGWGRWSTGYRIDDNGVITSPRSDLHYIVASDTTTLAQLGGLTGTANYTTVIGGTRATDQAGNIAPALANVNMAVDFGNNRITQFDVTTIVDSNVYNAQMPVTSAIDTALTNGINLGPASLCNDCRGEAGVAFLGPQAQGAATIYTIRNTVTSNAVNGTAVLLNNSVAATMAK